MRGRTELICFNSRAREGRDLTREQADVLMHVSIHAPARGATDGAIHSTYRFFVSIHAPARGATGISGMSFPPICFNSRAREGRDAGVVSLSGRNQVSIHAPARGATGVAGKYAAARCFNSRAREGRDGARTQDCRDVSSFQFTRPRGARHSSSTRAAYRHSFNSRAREGRDERTSIEPLQSEVSIHAPARGATLPWA